MQITYLTHQGPYKVCNDDALLIDGDIFSESEFAGPRTLNTEERPLLCAAADGMGGHAYGRMAARIVLEVVQAKGNSMNTKAEIRQALLECLEKLNQTASRKRLIKKGIGSTIAGVTLGENGSYIFNCGDTRIYHSSRGKVKQISKEQYLEHKNLDEDPFAWSATPEPEIPVTIGSGLTDALVGGMKIEDTDFHIQPFSPRPGDRILICTDGIWGEVEDNHLNNYLSSMSGEDIASLLCKDALDNGSRDNLSVILMEF